MDYDEPLEILCSDNEVSGLLRKNKTLISSNTDNLPRDQQNFISGEKKSFLSGQPNHSHFLPPPTPTNFSVH